MFSVLAEAVEVAAYVAALAFLAPRVLVLTATYYFGISSSSGTYWSSYELDIVSSSSAV